jgi:LacI family transcriptional regulator
MKLGGFHNCPVRRAAAELRHAKKIDRKQGASTNLLTGPGSRRHLRMPVRGSLPQMTKANVETGRKKRGLSGHPTMADVADLAGVSAMTVSRVMNGKGAVCDGTRRKIARAVAALHYSPHQEARQLAGARPIRVGFFYSSLSDVFLSELLLGLLNQSSMDNVQLIVQKCDPGQHGEAQIGRLVDHRLDGIIVPAPLCDDKAVIACLAAADIPAVLVACDRPGEHVGAVSIDDHQAAYQMTRHLIALGHRRIGFVTGHPDQTASARRLAGYRAAVEESGADVSDDLVVQGMFTYRSGLDAAERLLGLPERPTAIFASNDDMAAATVAVAHCLGLDVPGDLTVTGFDDTALATTIWPELTTVRQPSAAMARMAMQMVVRHVRALGRNEQVAPERVRIDFELVRRQSDAAPRIRPQLRLPA